MQLIMLLIVDFGTPLFINSWYCVISFACINSDSRLLTASFNCKSSPPYPCNCTNYYRKGMRKISPVTCTIPRISCIIQLKRNASRVGTHHNQGFFFKIASGKTDALIKSAGSTSKASAISNKTSKEKLCAIPGASM